MDTRTPSSRITIYISHILLSLVGLEPIILSAIRNRCSYRLIHQDNNAVNIFIDGKGFLKNHSIKLQRDCLMYLNINVQSIASRNAG